MIAGKPDERFEVMKNGEVRLNIGVIIPHTNKQTTANRRSRLRDALNASLAPHGWKPVRPNVYAQL